MVKKHVKKRYLKDLVLNKTRVTKPNVLWELDLIYFPKKNFNSDLKQQTYFVVVDSFSKYCISARNVTKNQTTDNFINILNSALSNTKIKPKIIHSDFGTQFTSKEWYLNSLSLVNQKILVSLGTKGLYNTYAINYFIRMCRQRYLNPLTSEIKTTEKIDDIFYESIQKYNNEYVNDLKATANDLYFSNQLDNAKNVFSYKVETPYNTEQKYIEYIYNSLKENKSLELIKYNLKHRVTDSIDFHNTLITDIKPKKIRKTENIIKKKARDLINEADLLFLLKFDDRKSYKSGKIVTISIRNWFQLRIGLILLYLTGCRVSEIGHLTFKDIEKLLKDSTLSLWITKDKLPRVIYFRNVKLLKELDDIYHSYKSYCLTLGLVINLNETYVFFKVIEVNGIQKAANTSVVSYLKSIVNYFLQYVTFTSSKHLSKGWSTHSFRHSIITRLINEVGIEKTCDFIGHTTIATTQLYHKKENNHKMLKELAEYV